MTGDKQPDANGGIANRLSRRKVIELTAVGSVGLAGCSSGDTPTGTPNDGDGGTSTDVSTTVQETGEPITTKIASAFGGWEPSKTNMNRFSTAGNEPPFFDYLWFEGTTYRDNSGRIIYFTIDDVEFNNGGKEVVFHFKDDYTWWDGTSVTAEDYLIQRQINQIQTHNSLEEAPYTLELVDDYTIKEIRNTPVNPDARLLSHITALYTKRDIYREWLEKYKDASGQSEVEQVTQDLEKMQISFQDAVDQGYGMGLFKPTQWNPNRVTWEKFEDHPRADWTNLETWTWELVEGDQKFDQAFNDNRFDMGELNFNLVNQHDKIGNVEELPVPGVPKLAIRFGNKHLARRPVRRAIAYVIDYDEIRKLLKANFGTPYVPHKVNCGMSSSVAKKWVGSDHLGKMINYGTSAQPEKAAEELRNGGYEKDGDFWVGPDGDAIKGLKYISPPWGIYQEINKYLAPKLTDFGIGTKSVLPSRSNFYNRLNESYEFDLVNWYHAGFHPSTSYSVGSQFGPSAIDDHTQIYKPVDDIEETPELTSNKSPRMQYPIRPKFPSEVGARDLSGGSQTIYPIKWWNIMGATQDEDRLVELTKKFSWFYNWQLPHIGFYEEVWNYWGRTDTYSFRGNHSDTETERTKREHKIANEDAFQVKLGHVSSQKE